MSAYSSLPSEIIEAILCLLPVKSLGRFKSVSKTWNSLISDPHFIKKHLLHLQNTKLILLSDQTSPLYSLDTNQLLPYLLDITSHVDDVDDVDDYDDDDDDDVDDYDDDNDDDDDDDDYDDDDDIPVTAKELSFRCEEVYGSCNGLILAEDENETIFLINPTTQEHLEIPLPPVTRPQDGEYYGRYYGFGYDSSTDDYKVVSISVRYHANNIPLVSVYSLRNNSWKELPNSPPYNHGPYRAFPVVVNQNVHWYANSSTIVAFSFITEEFNVIRFDLFKGKMVGTDDVVDIGGKLGLLFRVGVDVYELWVMEDYGVNNSWTKVCCLDFGWRSVEPVCLVEGSNRDIILDVEGEVYVFNIDKKIWRHVWIDGCPFGFTRVAATYVESLESPKRILRTP